MSRYLLSAGRLPLTRNGCRSFRLPLRRICSGSETALEEGRRYLLRVATKEVDCEVAVIHRIIDTMDLSQQQGSKTVSRNQVAELTLRAKAPIAFDLSSSFEATGRFVLVDEYDIAGGGIVTEMIRDDQEVLREEARRRDFAWVKGEVGIEERAQQYGHRAAIVLISGGRHTGKSFLAKRLEAGWSPMDVMPICWTAKICGEDWTPIWQKVSAARPWR